MTGEISGAVTTTADPAPLRPMALLRIRPFAVLYLNATVIGLSVMAQTVARSWLAFELTGSNAALGGVLLAFGVAMLVMTPWGGVAADRLPKRLVLQVSVGLLAASSAWIGLAAAFDVIEYWMLLGASVLQAVAFAVFGPARMAFLGEVVPRGSLGNSVSMLLVNNELSRVVGPAVAGVVVGAVTVGIEIIFLSSAALLALGVLTTVRMPPGLPSGDAAVRSPLGELTDGIRYVLRSPQLTALLWCGFGVTMAGLPYVAFLPTVSSDLFDTGSAGYGVLSATAAVGAVVVGLLMGRRRHRGSETRTFVVAGVVFGAAVGLLAVAPTFWAAVLVLLVVGAGNLAFQTANQSLLLGLSDMAYHGRIQGLVMMSFGAFGIAALPLGALADAVGLRWVLGGMGVATLLVMGAFVLVTRGRLAREDVLRDLG
ncbi:MFS transporter [Trujillonella endophytica]|uniref:Predicted arabinose efflux permease, MFS family n=1 Tax=Trujillonella endophytica TaxID=673521 RepID=A0A1H8W709_9ACTN|nr:MFS transporter [Trujillella endophytica]SEP23432.1 Predicted arabinose efflux permease, MFS family [Trujillella endophytica]